MGVHRDVVYNLILFCVCQLTERKSKKITNDSRERGTKEQWHVTGNKLEDLCLFVTALMESYAFMQHAFKLPLSAVGREAYRAFKSWQYFLPLCLHLAPHPFQLSVCSCRHSATPCLLYSSSHLSLMKWS